MCKKFHIPPPSSAIIITEVEVQRERYREAEVTVFMEYSKSNESKRNMVDRDEHKLISKRQVNRMELTRKLLGVSSQQRNVIENATRYLGNETEKGMNRVGQWREEGKLGRRT